MSDVHYDTTYYPLVTPEGGDKTRKGALLQLPFARSNSADSLHSAGVVPELDLSTDDTPETDSLLSPIFAVPKLSPVLQLGGAPSGSAGLQRPRPKRHDSDLPVPGGQDPVAHADSPEPLLAPVVMEMWQERAEQGLFR